jgi:hypothetical protein
MQYTAYEYSVYGSISLQILIVVSSRICYLLLFDYSFLYSFDAFFYGVPVIVHLL